MIKKNKLTLILTSLVMLIPILVGLLLWDRLPEQVPSHWGINGEVDDWSSKAEAVFLLPLVMLVMHWVCVLASSADPKSKDHHPKAMSLVLWLCPIISLVINTMVYATALGYTVNVELVMPLLVGAMFIAIGNLMPKLRQSYTLGIKLPWTLNNEENWNKTHRFAGKIWVIGGVVLMATAIWGSFWFLIGDLVVIVAAPTIYSYCLFRKHQKAQ